eukprot:6189462-Pleurochrysis_carterae.AAC.1
MPLSTFLKPHSLASSSASLCARSGQRSRGHLDCHLPFELGAGQTVAEEADVSAPEPWLVTERRRGVGRQPRREHPLVEQPRAPRVPVALELKVLLPRLPLAACTHTSALAPSYVRVELGARGDGGVDDANQASIFGTYRLCTPRRACTHLRQRPTGPARRPNVEPRRRASPPAVAVALLQRPLRTPPPPSPALPQHLAHPQHPHVAPTPSSAHALPPGPNGIWPAGA